MTGKREIRDILLALLLAGSAAVHTRGQDTLRVGITIAPPFIIQDGDKGFSGLSIDLWETVATQANIQTDFVVFGDEISIIRALDYKELDLTINPLVNTPGRTMKFAVTQPFYTSEMGVAITTASQSQFRIFVSNFFSMQFLEVIGLLVLILLFFGTLLWLLERNHNKYQFRPGIMGMLDGLWWAAVTMTTVGYGDKAPKSNAGKTIAVVWMFTAVIIISSFTATIASTLTVNSLESRINNLSDLKTVERIGVIGASEGADFALRNDMVPYSVFRTPEQGLRGLAAKEVNVLIFDKTGLEYLIANNRMETGVKLLPFGFESRYRCWMMYKSHPRFEEINYLLVQSLAAPAWKESLSRYGGE